MHEALVGRSRANLLAGAPAQALEDALHATAMCCLTAAGWHALLAAAEARAEGEADEAGEVEAGEAEREAAHAELCELEAELEAELQALETERAAMDADWARLRVVPRPDGRRGVWEESLVKEWPDVRC